MFQRTVKLNYFGEIKSYTKEPVCWISIAKIFLNYIFYVDVIFFAQ